MSEARRWSRAGAALALACLLAAPLQALAAPWTIAVARSPLSLPLYVAEAEGYLAQSAGAPRIVDCVGGHRCLQLLLDGAADVATVADSPLVFKSFERDDYVIFGTFATSSSDVKLVGRRDAGIGQPAQLAGKKVAVVHGTSSQFFLDSYLLLHGVDPRSVQLVALQPEEMAEAVRTGRVAAVAAWEPYAFASVAALKDNASVLPHSGVYRLTFNLVARRRLAGTHDRELAALLGAVERAQALIRDEPRKAQAILRARLGVDQRFVDWVWPGLEYRLGLDQSLVKTLESEARWALREGYVAGASMPNYMHYIHAGPLTSVNPHAVGLPD